MASKIEWTDETYNPVTGCTKISTGCKNCYAARMARRLAGRYGYPEAPHHFDVTLHPDRLEEPLRWRKPRRVFVCSMSDLFHEDVRPEFIHQVFETMMEASKHTFQILTKRPEKMQWFIDAWSQWRMWPLPNIWLGVSAENQEQADTRIPWLLQTPAAVRFVSIEPMLEEIYLSNEYDNYLEGWSTRMACYGDPVIEERFDTPGIDQVIIGGESGPGARPMQIVWARSLVEQCKDAGVPVFVKQLGGRVDKRSDPALWPEDLRVREYPRGERDG